MARIWPKKLRLPGGQILPQYRIGGGSVDRERPVPFRFGGHGYRGFAGDTLASALLAHGIEPPESVSLLRAGEAPASTRPMAQELYDDLTARHRTNGHFRRFLPGYAPSVESDDVQETEHVYDHTDYLIVGSGLAGLSAALERAETGADVILIERDFEFGGSLLHDDQWIDGLAPGDWRRRALDRLLVMSNVRMLSRTTALQREGEDLLHAEERPQGHLTTRDPHLPDRRLRHIKAREMIFEIGTEDQIFSFRNNLLQGIFNLEYALILLNRYAVLPGHRMVLYVGHTDGYRLAASLMARGIKPAAIIDTRGDVPAACHHFARQSGIPLYPHHRINRAIGFRRLRGVVLQKAGDDPLNRDIHLDCDCLVQSAGVFPRTVPERLEGEGTFNRGSKMLSRVRRGPLYEAQKRAGARHRTFQGWQLAAMYPLKEESLKAARHREARAAWTDVAMAEISHLGRIDLQGPDAAGLLARAFGERTELAPGRMRAVLLTEVGGIARA
ncbi:FAD-dependent oxidoreductase, partial [Sneathiella sp.]|uniref:FAD-dependent oxidoreductase n=1 Tax=Sneathiella sp. TaxID=1964365 RepID=UPI002620AAAD